jgi:hypothetical protein
MHARMAARRSGARSRWWALAGAAGGPRPRQRLPAQRFVLAVSRAPRHPAASCWPAGWRRARPWPRPRRRPRGRDAAYAPRIHRDPSHVVVGGRPHGQEVARRDRGRPRRTAGPTLGKRRATSGGPGRRGTLPRCAARPARPRPPPRRAAPAPERMHPLHEARPSASIRRAPSPRSASVRSGMGSRPAASAVGWNCTNSRSARRAPASAARRIPCPRDVGGFVVAA